MSERLKDQSEYSAEKAKELAETGAERAKELEKDLERSAEKTPEQSAEKLQEKAEKLAEKQEKKAEKQSSPAEKRKDTPLKTTKAARNAAFNKTMTDTRSHMSAPSKAFSRFIHAQPVEKTSEFVGATVARPNALLAGAMSAFVLTLAVYLIARYYGYPLTGTESIASFIIGWVLGIVFDYFRVMITGKKA